MFISKRFYLHRITNGDRILFLYKGGYKNANVV